MKICHSVFHLQVTHMIGNFVIVNKKVLHDFAYSMSWAFEDDPVHGGDSEGSDSGGGGGVT